VWWLDRQCPTAKLGGQFPTLMPRKRNERAELSHLLKKREPGGHIIKS
jgi:hypothetical protein